MMFSPNNPSPYGKSIILTVRSKIGTDGRVPKSAQPWPSEPDFISLELFSPEGGFESEEAINEFLMKYMPQGEKPRFPKPVKPWHKAQEAAYAGWKKKSARGRSNAAEKALSLSSDTPDAYLLLAHDSPSWEEALDLENQALKAAQEILQIQRYEENPGPYWGEAITRPYMRSVFAIGYSSWKSGQGDAARERFRELLSKNPEDNQGARYLLAAILLEKGEYGEIRRLMAQYMDDGLCHWSFNKALLHFRRRGDDPAGWDLLRQALLRNRHVPAYLSGKISISSLEMDSIEPGKEDEAREYTSIFQNAWKMVPGAVDWIKHYSRV